MKNVLKMFYAGISVGCLILVFIEMIFFTIGGEYEKAITHNFVPQAIGSMIVGVGFCVPTLIYNKKNISMGLKVLIHMGTGFIIYFIAAFSLKWIDVKYGLAAVITDIAVAAVFSFLVWFCFYSYSRKQAKIINSKIKEKQSL